MCRVRSLNIGTLNVRGLREEVKQDNLVEDANNYGIDICCIQEAKTPEGKDEEVNEHRLIILEAENRHYGNGFVVSPKWKDKVTKYWKISERICAIQINVKEERYESRTITDTKLRISKKKTYKCHKLSDTKIKIERKKDDSETLTVINIYAPHTGRLQANLDELEDLYNDLSNLLNDINRTNNLIYIAGDFNAKIGKQTDFKCLGKYSRGRINNSGVHLLDFCEANNLFIANSAFQHKASRITTWESQRLVNGRIIRIYNQIDYIICTEPMKKNLQNARSYAGTKTDTDHRLVIASFDIQKYKIYNRITSIKREPKLAVNRLCNNQTTRERYQEELREQLRDDQTWTETTETILKVAKPILAESRGRSVKENDPEMQERSEKQKKLRLQIKQATDPNKIHQLKAERNNILRQIHQKAREQRKGNRRVSRRDWKHTKQFANVQMHEVSLAGKTTI
jgi:exonuclease III